MRLVQRTERVGELLGPIDWSYDFEGKHPGSADEVEALRRLDDADRPMVATTDGGFPRIGWKRVIEVGMYDGWPYWKPTPSVLLDGPLGGEWSAFTSLTAIAPCKDAAA